MNIFLNYFVRKTLHYNDHFPKTLFQNSLHIIGFKESIVGKEVLPPPILEKTFGLTGGNIFHGAMSLDQLYLTRPVAEEWVSPSTPIKGLYMCGSGGHPGGGVMGSPGRLAAQAVAKQLSKKWKFK